MMVSFVFFIAFFPLTSSSELMKMYVNKDNCGGCGSCVGAGVKAAVGGDAVFCMLPSAGTPEGLQRCESQA